LAAASPVLSPKGFFSSSLPKVLLLGDSISIGYWPFVAEMMQGEAVVTRPLKPDGSPENCEGTTRGLQRIEHWLGETKWDLIHFNFGLHDIKHVDPDTGKNSQDLRHPRQAEPRRYRKNLKQITKRLQETGAKLVFATTTPYPAELNGPLREFGDDETYNQIARKIMAKNEIPVNDLHAFVKPQMAELQRPQNVHFTKQGSKTLAEEVCRVIRQQLS
jgi:lysophospholipase L1-like esterase